jgi:hypothetical protein
MSEQTDCDCLFCRLAFELTCEIIYYVQPATPRDLFRLAAVSSCFRCAVNEADGLSIELGRIRNLEKTERLLRHLAISYPRLSLITFSACPPRINNHENTYATYTNWTSPLLYGRLVRASLSGEWHDQGWGNQKGLLFFEICDAQGVAFGAVRAAPGIAPHHNESFETTVGRDDWPSKFIGGARMGAREQQGFRLRQTYHVGGGGGHSLHVNGLLLTIAISPREWNVWMEEHLTSKLVFEEGWVWCMDGAHPSLLLVFNLDGTARFFKFDMREETHVTSSEEPGRVNFQQEVDPLNGTTLKWEYYPMSGYVVLRTIDEAASSTSNAKALYFLVFDPDYKEFYVYLPKRGRGARGFSLLHHPRLQSTYRYDFLPVPPEDIPRGEGICGPSSTALEDKVGRYLLLSGVEVFDPFDTYRNYSSVWDRCPPGQGHARSMLDSPLAWCAANNQPGEWMTMQVAPHHENRQLLGLVVQRRDNAFIQCVQKLKLTFLKANEEAGGSLDTDDSYSPTFAVGFGRVLFSKPVRGRYFRFLPTKWRHHISMRAGLLVQNREGQVECLNPPEEQRTYSSVWDNDRPGVGHARSMINSPQAWSAGKCDQLQWMVIDAGSVISAEGVQVQHREGDTQMVVGWRVETKESQEDEWTPVDEGAEFFLDVSEPRFLWFDAPVVANTVRITVLEWESHLSMKCGVVLAPGQAITYVEETQDQKKEEKKEKKKEKKNEEKKEEKEKHHWFTGLLSN